MNFLFWNLKGNSKKSNNLTNEIVDLVREHEIDILLLTELNQKYQRELIERLFMDLRMIAIPTNSKINLFTKLPNNALKPIQRQIFQDARIISFKILYNGFEVNLIATHFLSRYPFKERGDIDTYAGFFKDVINEIENSTENEKTIIVGDFNMNPFDEGMINITRLHAVMDKNIALKMHRSYLNHYKKYKYLYNPMWSFFGDLSKGKVAGTYYFDNKRSSEQYWHIYDQVLMTPELIPYFDESFLDIIIGTSKKSFLKNNVINNNEFSDHLPIKFKFNF